MATSLQQCEALLLSSYSDTARVSDNSEAVRQFLQGQFEEILESSECAQKILSPQTAEKASANDLCNFIKSNVESFLLQSGENTSVRQLEVLIVAASSLQLFSQNNWLGPPTERSPVYFLHTDFHSNLKELNTEAHNELSADGETVYSQCRHLLYLYIARIILLECRSFFSDLQSWDWWLMRCLLIHQTLLSDRCPTLKATVMELIDKLSIQEPLMTDETLSDTQIMFHIEAGYACHTYLEYRKAEDHFNAGKKIAAIDIKLTGAMGKRTQFQQDAKAQLVVQVERLSDCRKSSESHLPTAMPKNLPLDDDTVLNDVKFTEDSVTECPQISQVEQALIIGLMESYRRSRAQDNLRDEEVLTYIAFILRHVTNWSVSVMALHLRSKLEQESRRRVERSMMQLEELAKVVATSTSNIGVAKRIPLFYASRVPPLWTIQKDLATLLLSLGLTGEALDVFEKLEMWEDAIACYQKMGNIGKAETVIRERLAVQETPALLCFLGDVTREIEHYQKAWELSGHRNARSQRCMAYIYFHQGDYEKAMECFETSLSKNSLQVSVWFTYGCAAMACQNFSTGVKAFRKCVHIDYDNFEAWSNLSACYVKLHENHKAHAILQDALKCNYENWKLWENSLIISVDCGHFEDAIRSYHRLMDLKDKYIDNQVLNILTRVVLENIPDANGNPFARHMGKVLELFGRITSKVTSEGDIWMNYAKLCSSDINGHKPDMDKSLQYLQKAYRCFTQNQNSNWEKDVEVCKQVSQQAVDLAKIHIQCAEGKTPSESLKLLSAAKLMLRGAYVKLQKEHTDQVTQVLSSEVVEICQTMDECLTQIVSRIETLSAQ